MKPLLPCLLLACSQVAAAGPQGDPEPTWTQAELEAMSAEISGQLEELRGEAFARPVEVRVASSEDLFAYMRERMAKTETPEKLAADEAIAKLLGVVPVEMDLLQATFDLLETQVGGFYDPDSDSFSLMTICPRAAAPMILAHELGHALDDQLYGIDQKLKPLAEVTDHALAFMAVVEGSGTSLMSEWQIRFGDMQAAMAAMLEQQEALAGLEAAPMWVWKPLMAVYMRGHAFLTRSEVAAGFAEPADIARAFAEPPRSTEQVLHPEKYWDAEQRDEPRAVRIETGELPRGFALLREDVLGELSLATVLTPGAAGRGLDPSDAAAMLAVPYTNEQASGWDGDRVALFGEGEGRYLRLVTAWDSPRDAAEFYGGLQAVLPGMADAARAQSDKARNAGAAASYGEREDEVVLSVWHSIDRRDRGKLEAALSHAVE